MNVIQQRPELAEAVLTVLENPSEYDRVLEVLARQTDEVLDTLQLMSETNFDEWVVFCHEVARGKRLLDEDDAEALLEHQNELIDIVDAQL